MHRRQVETLLRLVLTSPWPYRIARVVLACIFLYGGVIKLFDPKAFAATISTYDLVPEILLPVVAIGLPVIETVAGAALLFDRPWGLHVISGLLLLFVAVLGYGIFSELQVDCGCFGADELNKQAGLRHALYRDLLLIGLYVPYLYLARRSRAAVEYRDGQS